MRATPTCAEVSDICKNRRDWGRSLTAPEYETVLPPATPPKKVISCCLRLFVGARMQIMVAGVKKEGRFTEVGGANCCEMEDIKAAVKAPLLTACTLVGVYWN